MKSISLLLLSLGIVVSTSAQVKQFEWETPKSVIKQQEGNLVSETEHQLVYHNNWAGNKVVKRYEFLSNKLVRTTILIKSDYQNKNRYITSFKQINRKLIRQFGSPHTSNARVVLNKKLANDPTTPAGQKLSAGAIGFESKWQKPTTNIRHTLRGNGYEIIHVVVLSTPNYNQLKQQLANDYQ